MQLVLRRISRFTPVAIAVLGLLVATAAGATGYSVWGTVDVFNPSAGAVNPGAKAPAQMGPKPVTFSTVQQLGTGIQLPQKFFQFDGWSQTQVAGVPNPNPNATANGNPDVRVNFRSFPVFPCCAQLTYESLTYNDAASFAAGAGAGDLSWCPTATGCTNYTAGTLKPARVAYQAGLAQYGGVLKLLRNVTGQVFFIVAEAPVLSIASQANTLVAGVASQGGLFSGGLTNHATVMDINLPGNIFTGGALTAPGGVLVSLGNPQGVSPNDPNDGTATGFKMSTGTVFVSDATPPTENGGPFSSSIVGYDNRTVGGNGTIKLVGSSVAYNGSTGNNFFRTSRVYLNLPEPGASLGLAVGMFALVALARRRVRS